MTAVRIGTGSCGLAAGAENVARTAERLTARWPVDASVHRVGCQGACHREVLVEIDDGERTALYGDVTAEAIEAILRFHLLGEPASGDLGRLTDDDLRTERQVRLATRNCGHVRPGDVDDYLAKGGFDGLQAALRKSPAEVRRTVAESGLRGRGGAGFDTATKWGVAADASDPRRYVICNGDEGDPGAFMDRTLMESDPLAVLEGMTIAAWAIGAREGIVYVRHEYPLAVARMEDAIQCARAAGYLGAHVAGHDFTFDVRVRRGAGAFVCGEETALIASLEGFRGVPRVRPPFPAEAGFRGHPTVINNVETLATVPWILARGAAAFRAWGTNASPGTKVLCLAGDVRRGGMVEVPLGISLRTIIEELGDGSPFPIKAVQIGGPSGGCLPAARLDTPLDYEGLAELGGMLGSGGIVVMDERRCMVDVARYFTAFMRDESCGVCTSCRGGTVHLASVLDRICRGEGDPADLARLEALSEHVAAGSLCGLGKTAPNPVLSTLRYFREEYEAHVYEGRCPAGVCRPLIRYSIDAPNCDGCSACKRACPADAIRLDHRVIPLSIDDDQCVRCNACLEVCPFDAVRVCS